MLPDHLEAVCLDIGGVVVQPRRGFLAEEVATAIEADVGTVRQLLIEHGKRRRATPRALAAALATGCGTPALTPKIEEIVRQRHCDMAGPVLYPDALPVLRALRAAGWRLCFLSNAICDIEDWPRQAYFSLAEAALHSWEIGHCKPAVEAFRAVEQRMGLAPHQIVSVGDSLHSDVFGALNAGWSAVHLPRTRELPTPPHAVPTIRSLFDLLAVLPRRPGQNLHPGGMT